MSLGASIVGFIEVIRPVIAIDATHLKARNKGVLLVTVCKDGNEMIYLLTFGFCAYHLAQNLIKMCKQEDDMIKLYYRATYTYCIEEFKCEMTELKDTHHKCYDNLQEIGIEKISRVRSPKRRYKMITTNITESMNSCLLAIRKLPITSIAEFIRHISYAKTNLC
ncbi:hypothetical protein Ddye_001793 [Dipteronia dyeriana]|uniref:Transposase n=1 Tax=Dipteronia dyeriana TaxID=168575 RepID=A0AAE0CTV8_9ROSI|nr:hypothetical protein Ddye_001793 [Dipteronia dyeriana]